MHDQPSRSFLSSVTKSELDLVDRLAQRHSAAVNELARLTTLLHGATLRHDHAAFLSLQQEVRAARLACEESSSAIRILRHELTAAYRHLAPPHGYPDGHSEGHPDGHSDGQSQIDGRSDDDPVPDTIALAALPKSCQAPLAAQSLLSATEQSENSSANRCTLIPPESLQ